MSYASNKSVSVDNQQPGREVKTCALAAPAEPFRLSSEEDFAPASEPKRTAAQSTGVSDAGATFHPLPPAISFTVPIAAQPVQFGGKRMMIRNGKPIFFKNKRTASYENSLLLLAASHKPVSPIESAVRLSLTFVMPRPGSLMRRRDAEGLMPATKRPDMDNLTKGVLDPLTKLGFWRDDAQVTELFARKCYAEKTGSPRIEITIEALS